MVASTLPVKRGPPLRWTYAGALDDMVAWYPWPKIKIGKRSLDERLAYSVVVGTPMLINDGYLLLNDACVKALKIPHSPLRVLLNDGYVRVLSRNSERSFEALVREGAKQKIPTYEALYKNKRRWSAIQKVVAPVESMLRDNAKFVGWPKPDLTQSYIALVKFVQALPHEQRGLEAVPARVFDLVADKFIREMQKEPTAARSNWQRIAATEAPSQRQIDSLMRLANEVYHLNFGIGLTVAPPDDMPEHHEIAVQTRMPLGLMSLYKTHTPALASVDSIPKPLTLPRGLDYSNGNVLLPFLSDSQPVGAARKVYLETHAAYLAGATTSSAMSQVTNTYQQQINEYLTAFVPRGRHTSKIVNVGVAAGAVVIGVSAGATLGPAAVIGAVAYFTSEFAVPTLTEKWRPAGKLDEFINTRGLKPQVWNSAVAERRVLAALTVDRESAKPFAPVGPATGPSR